MWQPDSSSFSGGCETPFGRDGRWLAPITRSLTVNGMALVHTWHFQRDGDAPRKNHQDAWLSPHSAAEPFCLAESPPAAH